MSEAELHFLRGRLEGGKPAEFGLLAALADFSARDRHCLSNAGASAGMKGGNSRTKRPFWPPKKPRGRGRTVEDGVAGTLAARVG